MATNRKERKRANAFDIVIILLLLCLLVTFGYRIYVGIDNDNLGTKEVSYVLKFECEDEYDSLLKYLKEGDAVYFAADGKLLGYLYAGENDENGAIFEIIDDIPTFAGNVDDAETQSGDSSEKPEENGDNNLSVMPFPPAEEIYEKIRIGGQIGLNSEAVKVKSKDYYSIGDTNITEGSVIEVYTKNTVFTIKITDIALAED